MKNSFGNAVTVTLFGESHGPSIGAVIDGLAPGMAVDEEVIRAYLARRRPAGDISTARCEADEFVLESGVFQGKTTGTPVCVRIPNNDTRSKDYAATRFLARPSHADYTAHCKYHGFEDYRGGGHFSGRITAALVAAGAIVMPALQKKGIRIASHILRCGGVSDRAFENLEQDIVTLSARDFGVLDERAGDAMQTVIREAKAAGDSVGGVLETLVTGLPAGVGEPWFDTVESMLSHMLFAVPAVKGVEFGDGFALAELRGSEANDPFCMDGDRVVTATNRSGGINGGITNGMPILFRAAIRPTPTIGRVQNTVDMRAREDAELIAAGRHDPCIVHRARVVVECVTALVLADMLAGRYGTDWLGEE